MGSTPPYNNETDETTGHTRYPAQRRNGKADYRSARPARPYYSDEHPEVPKVRRASLYVDEESSTEKISRVTKSISTPSSRSRRSEQDLYGTSSSPRTAQGEKNSHRTATRSSSRNSHIEAPSTRSSSIKRTPPVEIDDFFETFEGDTEHTEAAPHTATKIMVTPQRRPRVSTVYEPLSSGSHRSRGKHKKPAHPLFTLWHNRTFMTTLSVIIVMIITLPMIVNVVINNLYPTITTIYNPGTSDTTGVQAPTTNSHGLIITPSDTEHPAPPVFASSAYLLDADTGATLYAHNPFSHLPMMSTTKLMTATLAIEKGNPDQKVTINDAISNDINQLSADSSVMGIKKGETYTLRDLLYGLLLVSGNDAAVVIADDIGGNVPNFVAMMNQRANQMGLHDTHYMNPHGLLDPNHYSSAHDLALIGKFSMSIPLLHQISGTKNYLITQSADHAEHNMFNGNQFLWWYPGVDGGKPGWDGGANFVQVVSSTRNNHHLIGVTMHTSDWWTDMRDLMNWGFNNFQWISPHDVNMTSAIPYATDWNYFVKDKKDTTLLTADHGRYYIYTGYSVTGIILSYFDKNGGLQKLGYPLSLPKMANNTTVNQRFEHSSIQCNTTSKQCRMV